MQKYHVQITRLVNSTTFPYRYASKASMYKSRAGSHYDNRIVLSISRPYGAAGVQETKT
jgi:hypothetical protein